MRGTRLRAEARGRQRRSRNNNTVIQNMFHTFHRTAAGSRAEWCHSCTVSHLMLTCQSVCLWIRLLYISNTAFKYYCEVTVLTAQCAELFTWCSAESDASPLNHISEMMMSVQQLRWREADFILYVHVTNSGCDNDAVWRQYKCTTRTRVSAVNCECRCSEETAVGGGRRRLDTRGGKEDVMMEGDGRKHCGVEEERRC